MRDKSKIPPTKQPESKTFSTDEVIKHATDRIITSASDIMIMQDGAVIRDVIELAPDNRRWIYHDGINYNFLSSERKLNAISLYFGWGASRNADAVVNEKFFDSEMGLTNILMHPIVEWRNKSYHITEAIMNNWNTEVDDIAVALREVIKAMRKFAVGYKNVEKKMSKKWVDSTPPCQSKDTEYWIIQGHPKGDTDHFFKLWNAENENEPHELE